MKKISRLIKCTAAAAVCALTFTGCENYNKMMEDEPQEYINLATENTAEAMVKSAFADEAAVIEKALKEGTMGFSFDFEGVKFNADAYVNEAKNQTSQLYSFAMGENEVEIYLAADEETLKLGLGDNVFEINADTLADDFAGSIFAPGSGSSVEIPQEEYDMIADAIKEVTDAIENGEDAELPEEYAEIEAFVDEIMSEVEVEKKADVTIDETEVKANILTFKMDKEDMNKLMEIYVDIAMEEMAAQGEEISREEVEAEFDTIMEAVKKMDIELVYYVNSKSHCLMQMDCKLDMTIFEYEENHDIKGDIVVTYGADPETSDTVYTNMSFDIVGEKIVLDIVSDRKSDDETEVKISVSVQGMTMDAAVLNFKKDGENYIISANIPLVEATATVEGTLKSDSKSVEATVDKVSYAMSSAEAEGNLEGLNIKAYIKQGGEYDDREAKNLFGLTEEELMAVVDEIGNDFGALAGAAPVTGAMVDYVDSSKQTAANANAKTIYVAYAAALTQLAIDGVELDSYEFYNEASGETSVTSPEGYTIDLSEYIGGDFSGYHYVSVNPATYAVEFALWSEEPIEYYYQYGETDQQWAAEEGQYIGCYPVAAY